MSDAEIYFEAFHTGKRMPHLLQPGCDAPIHLSDRDHGIFTGPGAHHKMDHILLPVAGRHRETHHDPFLPQRIDQFPRPGGVVHQKEHIGRVLIGPQNRQDLDGAVFTHDHQHQVIRVLWRKPLDEARMRHRLPAGLCINQDEATFFQIGQALPARQQGNIMPGFVQAGSIQAAQRTRAVHKDFHLQPPCFLFIAFLP
jgi:hypothetical protein